MIESQTLQNIYQLQKKIRHKDALFGLQWDYRFCYWFLIRYCQTKKSKKLLSNAFSMFGKRYLITEQNRQQNFDRPNQQVAQ